MASYGQHVAVADSYASLLLMLNFPADQKVILTDYFVQYGVDLYGCVQTGVGWPAFGGHRAYPNQFGEDMQTVYANQIPGV
jgi:hypothetical protein